MGTAVEPRPGSAGSQLLERDAEVAAIAAIADAARGGAGRLLAIEGRSGMGKTALVAEARAAAAAAGLNVLAARGGELEREFAYGVVRQLFEPLLALAPADERAELLSGAAALAAPLLDGTGLAEGGTTDTSFAMLHGLYWLTANLALRQPTALVVDDLQWADSQSLRWLCHLARRLEGLPLLVVIALRPPEQSADPELLTELVSDPAAAVVRPGALGEDSVAAFVRAAFGADPEPEFVQACAVATGGNPLFLRALLETLVAEGIEPTSACAYRVHEVGPEPVARAVSLRLARMPAEATALAQAVAVLGEGAAVRDAAALAGLDADVAAHVATTLARADILRLQQPLEFVHPVVRAAVYDDIPAGVRLVAHGRAAELLGAAKREPEAAAAHLLITETAGNAAVVKTLRAAAERALRRAAPDIAATYLRRALEEPPEAEELADVLCELGLAERRVDIAAAVRSLGEAVELIDDPLRRAEIALELGRNLRWINRPADALAVFEQAIEWVGDADPELRQVAEAELLGSVGFDPGLTEQTLERVRQVDEEALVGTFGRAAMIATVRFYQARLGAGRERAHELADPRIVQPLLEGDPSTALACAVNTLMIAELDVETDRFFERAIAEANRRGEVPMLASLLVYRGLNSGQRGDLVEAQEDLRKAAEIMSYGRTQQTPAYYHAHTADILIERGRSDEAAALIDDLGLGEELPVTTHHAWLLYARGRVRLDRRELERARSDFEQLGRLCEGFAIENPAFLAWRSPLALVLLGLDQRKRATELAREEVELARRWGAPRAIGIALRVRGLAEGGGAGVATLREAVAVLDGSSAKVERARALIELGAALRRANQRAESREFLRRGLELAHRSGALALAEQAQTELAATGARARRLVLAGVEALTPSERRVAELAAQSLTNKDIAQTLFVTPKTVEVHLSSVYRKLGIPSRAQLAGALAEG